MVLDCRKSAKDISMRSSKNGSLAYVSKSKVCSLATAKNSSAGCFVGGYTVESAYLVAAIDRTLSEELAGTTI